MQGLSGFGFGLTALSLWAWTLEPQLAAVLAVFGGLTGQVLSAFTVRRGFEVSRLLPFLVGGLVGLPLGVWLLPRMDVIVFKAALGAFLLIACPLMFFADRLPHVTRGGRAGDGLSGIIGGVMGGLGGFPGVVPTLWCSVRGFGKDTQRAIIQNFNLSMLAVTFGSYVATGMVRSEHLPLFGVVAPALIVPSLLGARLYARISQVAFRKVLLALLTLSGAALLIAAVPRL